MNKEMGYIKNGLTFYNYFTSVMYKPPLYTSI